MQRLALVELFNDGCWFTFIIAIIHHSDQQLKKDAADQDEKNEGARSVSDTR